VAAGVIWWLLRRQLFGLESTARSLAAMAEERLPLQPLPIGRNDEIGQLIHSFNHLIDALGQREATLKQILDTSSVAIFLLDTNGRITLANQSMADMFGWPAAQLVGKEYVELVHPDARTEGRRKMLALLASEVASVDVDRRYWRRDESQFWGHLTGRRFYDADGSERGLVGVIVDIDVRKHAEEQLMLAASVFSHAREGITITATDGTILDINESFTRITGYGRSEAIGGNPRMLRSSLHPPEFYVALWGDLLGKGYWHGEIWNRRKNGEIYAEILTISAVRDEQGRPQHYVALFTDITPMKEHAEQLERMAHYDALTKLPNRALLADRLHQAMVHAQRQQKLLAVAYLDLDGFKAINDGHGHQIGDQFLIVLAGRMKKTLRESDTLARLGGDEFVAVLLDLDDVAASEPMLSRLLAAAAQAVTLGDQVLQVSASLGVAFFPQADEVDADQLLRQADQAMYQAKLAGKNRYHFFDAAQDRSVRGHYESLQGIRQALAAGGGDFVLHYQPKVNMRSGALVGAEALIRWQHPDKGLLPPSAFLPLIENHALAVDLGEWVIAAALRQIERWQADGWHVPVSVNVGARQLQQAGFVDRLRALLAAHPAVAPGDLSIEILETSALEDVIRVSAIIEDCRQLGVDFALDDFGTGYSSLTYLKRLPVSQLKIDQSFVRDMLDDPDDLTILEGVVNLAAAFRRQVIAEGVETVEHGEMLLQLGCELAQGYGIARPMPAADLPAWARKWRPDPLWRDLSPISREDLPLLIASVELRAWTGAMDKYLNDARQPSPPIDLFECRFGLWLRAEGRDRYAGHSGFQAIEGLHRALHERASELCALRGKNDTADGPAGGTGPVRERSDELTVLRDALLAQLRAWLRERRAPA
ncbi:MAG: EAL domain-containing protein, partial [Propionivibrio sp.]